MSEKDTESVDEIVDGTASPEDAERDVTDQETAVARTTGRPGGLRGLVPRLGVTPMLAVLLVALLLAGGYAWWQVRGIAADSTADNLAQVDLTATAQVEVEISRALEVLFSYDHERPELAEANAEELLRDEARDEWDALFGQFEEQAVGQNLMLATEVRRVGVRELSADTADLVVFMDQTSARVGDPDASLAAAQLTIVAEHHDGAWRITEIALL